MKDAQLLNEIFRFKHKRPSDCQGASMCDSLAAWFAYFVRELEAVEAPTVPCSRLEPLADDRVVSAAVFSVHEVEVLEKVAQGLRATSDRYKRGDVWFDPWLPEYGCVLQRYQLNATTVQLEVVAILTAQDSIHCVDLDMDLEAKFSVAFTSKLRKAQNVKGSKRNAANNDLGHQKTPQFIAAVVKRTANSLIKKEFGHDTVNKKAAPGGGTTDVGLHTGGRARDTCWPVVQAAIAHNLCCGQGLFRKVMVAIQMNTLQQAVSAVESDITQISVNDGCVCVDDLFYMLEVNVQSIVELLEDGYDVSILEKKCGVLRSNIDGFVDILNRRTAEKYVMPECTELQEVSKLGCRISMPSLKTSNDFNSLETQEHRHRRALRNLEGCSFSLTKSCTLEKLLAWGESNNAPASCKLILMLRTFETAMFERALVLNDASSTFGESDSVEDVQTLVTMYQHVSTSWRKLPRMTSVLDVEQRSREMLVMWIAFCLVHQKCVKEIPLCAQYKIALEWKNFKVAVLSDAGAISALQHVAQYIRTWNNSTRGPPLFHLSKQAPTFEFAKCFGMERDEIIAVYEREVATWEVRVRGKWRDVEEKKQKAATLRKAIAGLKEKLLSKKNLLADEEARLSDYYWRKSHLKAKLEAKIESIEEDIDSNEATLEKTLIVPPYLVRPLPPTKSDAIQVIFMLMMPRKIEITGNLCVAAQRSLAPAMATPEMEELPSLSPTTWEQFYCEYAPEQVIQTFGKVFTVNPGPFSLPRSYGPRTVDDLKSLSQYRCVCVWDPTLSGSALTWTDSFGVKLDPFNATQASIVDSYIERLPQSAGHMQWMNAWPGEGETRGNMVYAYLHQKPADFEKEAFIDLGSLRVYPNQQYRKLQWALLDDVFPWSNCCVEIIVRQSLYQAGVLTDELHPQFLWKTDMFKSEDGLQRFCDTLEIIASKLKQTPRNFGSIPLFSELAGFVSQYSDDAQEIVKMFAGMARAWAENARVEYMEESSPFRIAEIRQKECVLYGFALLSYSLGPWDIETVQEVCELIVLFRTSFICASINVKASELMIRTESMVIEVMSNRISELVTFVTSGNTSTVLSSLVHLVNSTSPEKLEWIEVSELVQDGGGQFGSCFEAFDASMNVHYSVNLFSGIVLTDGFAAGGLPPAIRQHKRFVSLFGHCNFEVFSTNGGLRTERKYFDRLYDFALVDDELFVQELTAEPSGAITRTLQLCSTGWVKSLTENFPVQLRKLYSHWYWVEQHCVLFRPKLATCRNVLFVATFDDCGALECFKVSFNDSKRPYQEILSCLHDYDRFVKNEQSLLNLFAVLAKLEHIQFLYPLQSPQGILKVELPRFKMMFHLNDMMQLESEEHKGFVLASEQQFDDFLPRFSRYLVLTLRDKTDPTQSETRVLVPVGSVEESFDGMIDIGIPCKASNLIDVACYDIHRRLKTFETETIGARLQLAAVCARAGTTMPCGRLKMTGEEAAIQLLRACRPSRPFSESERDMLLSICKLGYREPAIKILVGKLLTEAERLAFLFDQPQRMDMAKTGSMDEKSEYREMCARRVQRNPLRSQFQRDEEMRALGHVQHASVSSFAGEVALCDSLPLAEDYVKSFETKLRLLLRLESSEAKEIPPFPLLSSSENAMSIGMLQELQRSWNTYQLHFEPELKTKAHMLLGSFRTLLTEVSFRRDEMETYVRNSILTATNNRRDRLLKLINYLPLVTVSDIVRCAFDKETLYALAPTLSEKAREVVTKAVIMYLELCVLEDKVERLIWITSRRGEMSEAQLIEELKNVREWESKEYPYWLAFEVEGRLQIRHEQFVIARHLIDHPGTVCQLNMGRGKTRVILPMLFLHFTQSRCPRVLRAHFLSPLLSEAQQFMHRYLSATSARLGIFEQPFHRQIDLSRRRLAFIRDSLEELKTFGGIQMVAPEHRMSLELKRFELGDDGPVAQLLDEILDSDQFVDILDECDALLHHKYRLVYAVGTPIQLGNGEERWMAAQALLRVVADKSACPRVHQVLQDPHVSCYSPDYATRFGAYKGIRLKAVVKGTEELRNQLKVALVLDLIDSTSFDLMWLNTIGQGAAARDALVRAMTNSSLSLHEALGEHTTKLTPYMTQLLALRGLVAFGVFEHCLEKRYCVEFGLPIPGTRPKKLAIPFRAADVPSERSEFSHPDVCIVLTLLAYYHNGLTHDEVQSTFERLLRLDISKQEHEYSRWFESVKIRLTAEEHAALCNVRHLSLADTRQLEMLCRVYSFCMEAINFYLNTCVFPRDTQQYPQRLARTAWNLAAGPHNLGFSGTNDNHRLLPLTVTQHEPEEPALLGTNGKMIDKLVHMTHGYEVIPPRLERTSIPWQSLLLYAIDKRAQALIDTGALLAGVTNDQAAKFLLKQPAFAFAGVTYYDSRKEFNCWMIAEKTQQITVPLKKASMLEKETFVIFDEARSRGSDMKLLPDAAAVLTLGSKLTKDKLMQGAGRMRQLGCNQTLWIASFEEVAQSMVQTCGKRELSVVDVLNWVMDNTKAEAVRGLLEWASNGLHFRTTQLHPEKEVVDDNWSLETLYQEKIRQDKIAQVIEWKARHDFKDAADGLVDHICRRGFMYGLDDEVCVTSHTDECEQELHVEEEVQQEEEMEVIKCMPVKEKRWEYKRILAAKTVADLTGVVKVLDMKSFLRQAVAPKEMARVARIKSCLFGTENFFATIETQHLVNGMNTFLRVIDVALMFENGQVLLVSECEADHILGLLWSSRDQLEKSSFCFVNLAFAWEKAGRDTKLDDVSLALGCHLNRTLPLVPTVACKLYNGDTTLSEAQNVTLESTYRYLLGRLAQREATLSNFVQSRGNSHKWTRSFLHKLCRRMDIEDCV
ncbi:hypothetical protein PsorP6_011514 [Peronosclerospora sorghi]|uniref:Uncharacterized protein n=1 Tax=Peronosclerospora sorghi TaxID=230839 RepID=A0ACC0WLN4_9STRA|nr:hypothetical protein PsorP6_011514 [Peronosclerospora sorghi]